MPPADRPGPRSPAARAPPPPPRPPARPPDPRGAPRTPRSPAHVRLGDKHWEGRTAVPAALQQPEAVGMGRAQGEHRELLAQYGPPPPRSTHAGSAVVDVPQRKAVSICPPRSRRVLYQQPRGS